MMMIMMIMMIIIKMFYDDNKDDEFDEENNLASFVANSIGRLAVEFACDLMVSVTAA